MNFRYMPELDLRFGYPVVLLVMLASSSCSTWSSSESGGCGNRVLLMT